MMNEKGSTVVLVTFAMMIVFLLGTALVNTSRVEFLTSQNYADEVKAYYIAEAGMEKALAMLRMDQSLLKEIVSMNVGSSKILPVGEDFGEGSFREVPVKVTEKSDSFCTIELESVGNLKRAERKVLVQAKIFYDNILFFEEGISIGSVAGKKGTITGSEDIMADFTFRDKVVIKTCTIEGNVKGYDVVVENSARVKGNVEYVNSISGEANITGTVTQIDSIDIDPLPVIPSEKYLAVARELEEVPGSKVFPGGYSGVFDLTGKESGIYFIDGPLTVEGTYTGKITVVATGNLTIGGGGIRTLDRTKNVLTLVSYSNILVGNSYVEGLLYVTPENGAEGRLYLSGSGTMIGAAIADVLDINGNVQLQFDAGLAAQSAPGVPAEIQINYWRESSDIF